MGNLLPSYRTTIITSLQNGITANTTCLYAFASNPVSYVGNTPAVTLDDYSINFTNDWLLLFGKRLQTTDIVPMIPNIVWTTNTVYTQYDNTNANLYSNSYYAIVPPQEVGGTYNIYKCIKNANGAASTQMPTQLQPSSFTLADGYTWRYITSISSAIYNKFATTSYVPCVPNTTIQAGAFSYASIENCVITNGGNGYSAYSYSNSNYVVGVINSTMIQVQNYESTLTNFYVNNSIYFYNVSAATSQLFTITGYTSNATGNFVTINAAANTTNITPLITKYIISPRVVFSCDANPNNTPKAYTTINTTSNSILGIVLIDGGSGITWCNVSIVTNSAAVASNASVYAIVPPSGGHGYDPATELNTQAMGIAFKFSNSEAATIPTNIIYNKIGILVNPYAMNSNGSMGSAYTANTFSELVTGNVSPSTNFPVGATIFGQSSNSQGIVAFCNGTNISIAGDNVFTNNETIATSNGTYTATLTINTIPQVYTKNIKPLYVQNIANVTRSANTTESYKLIVTL